MLNILRCLFLLTVCVMVACQPSNDLITTEEIAKIENEIKGIAHSMDVAWVEHDASKMMSYYKKSKDIMNIEQSNISFGWDAQYKIVNEWHSNNQSLEQIKEQVYVKVINPNVSILTQSGNEKRDDDLGNIVDYNYVWTAVFVLEDGNWKIVHDHLTSAKL